MFEAFIRAGHRRGDGHISTGNCYNRGLYGISESIIYMNLYISMYGNSLYQYHRRPY